MTMTPEVKKQRAEQRKVDRLTASELEHIEKLKNQKLVTGLTITIEWRKSRMWGFNPYAEAQVYYQDGTFERREGYTCSGCGYCKESTVIAEIFNAFLSYKLYQKHRWVDSINGKKANYPYGVYYFGGNHGEKHESGYISKPSFNGGVGTSCYNDISKFIGGVFEHVASGKTFDAYKYTDNK